MIDQLSVAVIEIEQQIADRAHFHQRRAFLVADEIEAEGGGGGRHGADAEQRQVEALGAAENVAQVRSARSGHRASQAESTTAGAWNR